MAESFVPGSTIKILPGMDSGVGTLTPLIPFNMIVDTDVGLLSVIYRDYMDEEVFNKDYFEGKIVRDMIIDLYDRKMENPLSLIIKDEYKDQMDDFYNQFMGREYDKILDKSVRTEFYRLVGRFERDRDIKQIITCERPEEVDILRSMSNTKDCNIIMADNLTPDLIKTREQFYFKSVADAIPFTKYLVRKSVYFAAYRFNMGETEGLVDDPLIAILIKKNALNIIDVFNQQKLRGEEA